MNIGLLVSGGLGLHLLKNLSKGNNIIFVMTDKNSLKIIDYCEQNNLKIFIGNPRLGRSEDFIRKKSIDVLISVNYLYIIEEDLISLPKKLAFNIHGSLLPKYRGRTPHVWAIINNEAETGITAHLIETGCDTGPIIEQVKIPINNVDTGNTILEKFNDLYVSLVNSILDQINNDDLKIRNQDHSKATYFGKRTPDDGLINWNWQKERIYNWVRAQAFPYPGAFTYYGLDKIIIDEIMFTDDGYDNENINGQILSIDPLKIKTPNGVILINKIRDKLPSFKQYEILN